MGKESRTDGGHLFGSMVEFARSGPDNGVNNFVLIGPVDVPTIFHTFVGSFPYPTGDDSSLAVIATRQVSAFDIYSQILRLEIPTRVERIQVKDDEQMRRDFGKAAAMKNLPSIVIGIGEARDTKEEVVVLCSIIGISPKKALSEIQDRIKNRMSEFN